MRALLGALLGLLVGFGAQANIVTPPTPRGVAFKSIVGPYRSPTFKGIPFLWGRMMNGTNSVAATDVGGTGDIGFAAPYAMHDIQAVYGLFSDPAAGEVALPNPLTWSGTFEYPVGTFRTMTFNGGNLSATGQSGWVQSDPWGQDFPAGAGLFVRTYVQVCLPPTAASAAANVGGGSLAAATYFIKITQVCGAQGESGPSPEASAAVVLNGTLTINWTPPVSWRPPAAPITTGPASVPPTAYNIYLSTATGTEVYLTTVAAPTGPTTLTYAGGITAGTTTPPANQVYPRGASSSGANRAISGVNTEGSNYVSDGGGANATGSNQTLNTTNWKSSLSAYTFSPIGVVGTPDKGLDVPVGCIYGDSIAEGVNDTPSERGIIARPLIAAGIPYWFGPKPGESVSQNALANGSGTARLQYAAACSDAVNEGGTNDIFVGSANLATLQSLEITLWNTIGRRGARVWQTTILPRGNTTDLQATIANQFPGSSNPLTNATNASPIVISSSQPTTSYLNGDPVYIQGVLGNTAANGQYFACNAATPTFQLFSDAACTVPVAGNGAYTSGGTHSIGTRERTRVQFNTWLRCGSPMVAGAAVACGTGGAITEGQSGHPLTGHFDINTGVEVDLSNTLALNGGRWLSNGSANFCTNDMTHPFPLVCGLAVSSMIDTTKFTAP